MVMVMVMMVTVLVVVIVVVIDLDLGGHTAEEEHASKQRRKDRPTLPARS